MRDFMLIARSAGETARILGSAFDKLVHEIESEAQRACPQIEWRADFDLGRGQYVKIFSAPDASAAMQVSAAARTVEGVRAEVTPLRGGW